MVPRERAPDLGRAHTEGEKGASCLPARLDDPGDSGRSAEGFDGDGMPVGDVGEDFGRGHADRSQTIHAPHSVGLSGRA